MIRFLIAIVLLTGIATAQTDNVGLTIGSGDQIAFRLEGGAPVAVRRLLADEGPSPGEIAVAMKSHEGDTLMIVQNRSPFAFDYRAYLRRNREDGEEATTVCAVLSNGPAAVEHWPYPIATIRLASFVPAVGDQVVCR